MRILCHLVLCRMDILYINRFRGIKFINHKKSCSILDEFTAYILASQQLFYISYLMACLVLHIHHMLHMLANHLAR